MNRFTCFRWNGFICFEIILEKFQRFQCNLKSEDRVTFSRRFLSSPDCYLHCNDCVYLYTRKNSCIRSRNLFCFRMYLEELPKRRDMYSSERFLRIVYKLNHSLLVLHSTKMKSMEKVLQMIYHLPEQENSLERSYLLDEEY